jgi:putative PIN family toxin of toxin-antitoxin system
MAKSSAKKLGSGQRNQWLKTLTPNDDKPELGNIRVLIDTNVWYSAFLYGGTPEQVVKVCRQNCQIISSAHLLNELLELLKEAGTPYKWRNNLEKVLKRVTFSIEPPDFSGVSRDPKDDPIISAAVNGNCSYLITNDNDLLELGGTQKMVIIKPSDFLQLIKANGI